MTSWGSVAAGPPPPLTPPSLTRSLGERFNADGVEPTLLEGTVIRSGRRVVVIDDDPTGTQSVANVPIVTQWTVSDLRWALTQPTTSLFVLTNSRSRSADEARQINREIVTNLAEAAAGLEVEVSMISRSHFNSTRSLSSGARCHKRDVGTPIRSPSRCHSFLPCLPGGR